MKLDERMKDALLLSFAFSFMMAIFAPLDAYMANADEFWFFGIGACVWLYACSVRWKFHRIGFDFGKHQEPGRASLY